MSKQTDEAFLKVYKKLIVAKFVPVRILAGGTKKAREHSHLFIHGNYYGGKLGRLLCNKGYKETQLNGAADTMIDLCPKCRDLLDKCAKIVMEMRSSEIFKVAGGEKPDPLTAKEILDMLIKLRADLTPKPAIAKPERVALFGDEETKVRVRTTQPWTVPLPLSMSESTAR